MLVPLPDSPKGERLSISLSFRFSTCPEDTFPARTLYVGYVRWQYASLAPRPSNNNARYSRTRWTGMREVNGTLRAAGSLFQPLRGTHVVLERCIFRKWFSYEKKEEEIRMQSNGGRGRRIKEDGNSIACGWCTIINNRRIKLPSTRDCKYAAMIRTQRVFELDGIARMARKSRYTPSIDVIPIRRYRLSLHDRGL